MDSRMLHVLKGVYSFDDNCTIGSEAKNRALRMKYLIQEVDSLRM